MRLKGGRVHIRTKKGQPEVYLRPTAKIQPNPELLSPILSLRLLKMGD